MQVCKKHFITAVWRPLQLRHPTQVTALLGLDGVTAVPVCFGVKGQRFIAKPTASKAKKELQ